MTSAFVIFFHRVGERLNICNFIAPQTKASCCWWVFNRRHECRFCLDSGRGKLSVAAQLVIFLLVCCKNSFFFGNILNWARVSGAKMIVWRRISSEREERKFHRVINRHNVSLALHLDLSQGFSYGFYNPNRVEQRRMICKASKTREKCIRTRLDTAVIYGKHHSID